jgi:type I restriction enzyme R subunit
VTVLVNGLPMVHIELKRRGVDIREAFNQIDRYQRDSFWAGSGLFEYVQLFVISNGTLTKYYSNTVRDGTWPNSAASAGASKTPTALPSPAGGPTRRTSRSPSWRISPDLLRQAHAAEHPHPLLRVRRGPQAAGDAALPDRGGRTHPAAHRHGHQSPAAGHVAAGGYIWHTTGQRQDADQLQGGATGARLPEIDKVLFVVDRKDLDYQTMREYERFEKGAANSNTSTAVLQRQLEDPNVRIIITTIQKLSRFVAKNKKHPVYDAHVVVIFDECHRSQFGDMHDEITRLSSAITCSASPARRSSPTTRARAATRSCAPRTGLRRQAAHLHDRRCHQRQERAAVPHRLHQHDQDRAGHRRQAGVGHRHGAGAARAGAHQRRSWATSASTSTRRPSVPASIAWRQAAATASIRCSPRLHRRGQTLLRRVRQAAKGLPPAQRLKVGLIYSFAANEDVDGLLGEEEFETEGLDQARAISWMRRSATTTPCSPPASTPAPTSSRTTTRICRSG